MVIVDTHVHTAPYWYEPIEALLFHMESNGVDKAVLVQFIGNYDNRYELECVRSYPGRFAAVVMVDTKLSDAPDTLEKWANDGAVGVRLKPDCRSAGPDPLAIWRKASELGLVVSCTGRLDKFAADDFRRLVEELPNLKIVMEHLGGAGPQPPIDLEKLERVGDAGFEPQIDYNLFEKVLALAKYPNIYIKLPGFGELLIKPMPSRSVPFSEPPRVVRMAYEAFGRERMMWGSNFPPCSQAEGYTNTLRIPMEKTPFFSEEDKEWIFGKAALSVWKMT
ncbi:amidohydrolase family protein [Chloroflexota bacterium]